MMILENRNLWERAELTFKLSEPVRFLAIEQLSERQSPFAAQS